MEKLQKFQQELSIFFKSQLKFDVSNYFFKRKKTF